MLIILTSYQCVHGHDYITITACASTVHIDQLFRRKAEGINCADRVDQLARCVCERLITTTACASTAHIDQAMRRKADRINAGNELDVLQVRISGWHCEDQKHLHFLTVPVLVHVLHHRSGRTCLTSDHYRTCASMTWLESGLHERH